MRVNQNGILLLGPTLLEFGTEAQKARFLPRMARCDDMWAQGWSEPNAGSDMAVISSRAIRDGSEYVSTARATWSTRAVFANCCSGSFAAIRRVPATRSHLSPRAADAVGITAPDQALNGKDIRRSVLRRRA